MERSRSDKPSPAPFDVRSATPCALIIKLHSVFDFFVHRHRFFPIDSGRVFCDHLEINQATVLHNLQQRVLGEMVARTQKSPMNFIILIAVVSCGMWVVWLINYFSSETRREREYINALLQSKRLDGLFRSRERYEKFKQNNFQETTEEKAIQEINREAIEEINRENEERFRQLEAGLDKEGSSTSASRERKKP